jgi:hypothetical protein
MITVLVTMTSGDSPAVVQVNTDDEAKAGRAAMAIAYWGATEPDWQSEEEAEGEINEMTTIVDPIRVDENGKLID